MPQNTIPLGVAAGRMVNSRESRNGWRASFRRCMDASFGSDSKFANEHKELSTPLGAAREIQEGIAVDPLLVGCGLKTHDVNQAQLDNKITTVINPNLFPITL